MRGPIISLLILLVVIISACRKDPDLPKLYPPIRAGIVSEDMTLVESDSILDMTITWDSLNLYGVATDVIFLSADSNTFLSFALNTINEDSLHLITDYPNPYPNFRLYFSMDLQVVYESLYIYMGLGSGFTEYHPARLNYGDTINSNLNLTQSGSLTFWQTKPPAYGPYGSWYSVSQTYYMAFRFQNGRYGWLEIDVTDRDHPKVPRYAYQNI